MRTTVVIVVVLMIIGGGIAGAIQYTKKSHKSETPEIMVLPQATTQVQPMQAQQAVPVQQPDAAVQGP